MHPPIERQIEHREIQTLQILGETRALSSWPENERPGGEGKKRNEVERRRHGWCLVFGALVLGRVILGLGGGLGSDARVQRLQPEPGSPDGARSRVWLAAVGLEFFFVLALVIAAHRICAWSYRAPPSPGQTQAQIQTEHQRPCRPALHTPRPG